MLKSLKLFWDVLYSYRKIGGDYGDKKYFNGRNGVMFYIWKKILKEC